MRHTAADLVARFLRSCLAAATTANLRFVLKCLQAKHAEQCDAIRQQYDEKINVLTEKLAQSEAAYQSLVERHHQAEPRLPAAGGAGTAATVQLKQLPVTGGDRDLAKRVEELELQVFELRQEVCKRATYMCYVQRTKVLK